MSYYRPAGNAWGARGNQIDDQGNEVAQSSAIDTDLDRYASMAATPAHANGPQIDRTASSGTRNASMSAIGLLERRANGMVTPAQRMAAAQTTGAVNAGYSGAASIKGGAMARAAASRGAVAGGARIQAMGDQDQAALAAREKADAAGQYNSAITAQRGADIGLATEQAKLEAGQRTANEGRDQFYENLGYSTQKARTDQLLGRSAADEAASNASRVQSINEQAAGRQSTDRLLSTVSGGVSGGLGAYQNSQSSTAPAPRSGLSQRSDPYTDPYTNSDERVKQDIKPMGYRSTMVSDSRAKAAAWDEGHRAAVQDVQTLRGKSPEELKRMGEGGNVLANAVRGTKADAYDEGKGKGGSIMKPLTPEQMPVMPPLPPQAVPPAPAPQAAAAPPPAAEPQESLGYLGQLKSLASRSRAMISDERTKNTAGSDDMAAANRSMAPFSYAYKPGFAEEAGQDEGERNVGPMAQNMAANPVAKTAIVKRPDGMLAIDKDKALKLTMGGLADLQGQFDDLKKRKSA